MKLFRHKKQAYPRASAGADGSRRKSPVLCSMEVKLLALEALQVGLTRSELAEIVGWAPITVSGWQKRYDAEGLPGLYRHPSSKRALAQCGALEKRFITECCEKQSIQPNQLTIHADRGGPMTAKTTSQLLANLNVIQSHSRPYVSDDNPFSESQFKTLKYQPEFPSRFGSQEHAVSHCRGFFPRYN